MLIIREATEGDADTIAALGRQFYVAAGLTEMLGEYSRESVRDLVAKTAEADSLVTLIADDGGEVAGFAAAVVYQSIFNPAVLVGQELFWWVEPDYRKGGVGMALLDALEAWANGRGAVAFTMLSMHGLAHESVEKMYNRAGYRPLEHTYVRAI